jgi:hypothetical protein
MFPYPPIPLLIFTPGIFPGKDLISVLATTRTSEQVGRKLGEKIGGKNKEDECLLILRATQGATWTNGKLQDMFVSPPLPLLIFTPEIF